MGRMEEAHQLVRKSTVLLRDHCPLFYFDVLAAKAWLEIRAHGHYGPETVRELGAFEEIGAGGRRALLIAQGFLSPSNSGAAKEEGSQFAATAPILS